HFALLFNHSGGNAIAAAASNQAHAGNDGSIQSHHLASWILGVQFERCLSILRNDDISEQGAHQGEVLSFALHLIDEACDDPRLVRWDRYLRQARCDGLSISDKTRCDGGSTSLLAPQAVQQLEPSCWIIDDDALKAVTKEAGQRLSEAWAHVYAISKDAQYRRVGERKQCFGAGANAFQAPVQVGQYLESVALELNGVPD